MPVYPDALRMGREPVMVDILPEIDGIDFDRAWERRVPSVIDVESGLTAFFISAPDLVTAKLAAGRPQDIADVAALREAAESQPGAADRKQALSESKKNGGPK